MILFFAVCLTVLPDTCHERQTRITADELTPAACGKLSQQWLAHWVAEQGGVYRIERARCVPAWHVERVA